MHTLGYELLYIVSSTKKDEEVKNVISAVAEILTKFDATILSHEQWSKRRLEYKIRGIEHGTYILAYFTVNEKSLGAIATALKHTADITRSIIIKHTNIASARSVFFNYYEEIKNKRRPVQHIRYTPQARPPSRPVEHTRLTQAPVKKQEQQIAIPEAAAIAIVEEKKEKSQIATTPEKLQKIDESAEKMTQEKAELTDTPQKSEEVKAPTATKSRRLKPPRRKPVKKPTLEELDTKLKQILEGEIEL